MNIKTNANATAAKVIADPDQQMIVDRIFSAVMEQRLAPRTKLSEAALCESFGVGRMRVRQALLLLASQGIVDLRSNRGAYVACPSPEEADEVFEARMMIEPEIVRSISADVSQSVLLKLRRHLDLEDHARKQTERGDIIRLSGEFHVELAKGHGNSVLTRSVRELVTRTSLIVGMFGVGRNTSCPEDEHSQIVEAIALGAVDDAAELVRRHLAHIKEGLDLSGVIPEQPDLARILAAN